VTLVIGYLALGLLATLYALLKGESWEEAWYSKFTFYVGLVFTWPLVMVCEAIRATREMP
jgi:hypothetical protein